MPISCPTASDFAVGISLRFYGALAPGCRPNRDPWSYPHFEKFFQSGPELVGMRSQGRIPNTEKDVSNRRHKSVFREQYFPS